MLLAFAALVLLAIALVLALIVVRRLGAPCGLVWLQRVVQTRFPEAPQWTGGDLAARMNPNLGPAVVIFDVRSEAEFHVSHLPGAQRFDPERVLEEVRRYSGTHTLFLVYCAVGYRASKCVTQLQRAGIERVVNLEGGIFAWANAGRPLIGPAGPTRCVHPYHRLFQGLIRKELPAGVNAEETRNREGRSAA